ncbi:growth-regulating factor 12-like [Apium graveolens]|uniref:growth-regulating factor 12-like n=1 Tax=Apium graveolens TaxID=4045 RepID=UPI003D79BCA3
MEPYNPSSKIARITEHGREPTICDNGRSRSKCSFSFLQIEELRDQVLIYKFIESGIPVPHHLLLPICKSVAHSLSDLKGLGFVGGLDCCNHRKNMEPEPGRCRRTDGKKWRCNKDVARPDQKYCKRHLHRGGSRSSATAKQQQNPGEKGLPPESMNSIAKITDALN